MERRYTTRSLLRQLSGRRGAPSFTTSTTSTAAVEALPPPSHTCESFRALSASIEDATGGRRSCPVHRLAERVLRGDSVPIAAVGQHAVPDTQHHVVDTYSHRVYGGRFVGPEGKRYVTTCQDMLIRVYDVVPGASRDGWRQTHSFQADTIRWTITDFDVSPCGRWLAYATINPLIHICDLDFPGPTAGVHREIDISRHLGRAMFGVMTLAWSPDGREIYVGTTGANRTAAGCIVVVNVETQTSSCALPAHAEDVNSVTPLGDTAGNLLLSGSDDGLVKLWDRREVQRSACGVFVGHTEGITHVSTKDDGRFFISQGKDQKIRLWDARRASPSNVTDEAGMPPKNPRWDYRFEQYPGPSNAAHAYRNDAVMSYAGHHGTLQTLIRSYLSPVHSTGQRYIYTGSSNGTCVVYDVLTGKVAATLKGHESAVRDISWHPQAPIIATVSWDHRVMLWATHAENLKSSMKGGCPVSAFTLRCEKFQRTWLA